MYKHISTQILLYNERYGLYSIKLITDRTDRTSPLTRHPVLPENILHEQGNHAKVLYGNLFFS